MKHMRSAAKASAAAKMKAMGGSCGGRSHKYASGGVVRSVKAYASGGSVLDEIDGEMPKSRMDRPSRSGKSKGGSKTNVNVIVMPKGSDAPPMPPVVPPPAAAAPPMPLPPPKPPMVPPQGPPDMPMHKHGGRVAAFKRGGKVHSDAAEDRKMIKGMVKEGALKKKADGGPVSEYLREREEDSKDTAASTTTGSLVSGGAAMLPGMSLGKRAALLGMSGLAGLATGHSLDRAKNYKDAAEKFENNDLPGRPDYEAEGKKRGGKVKRASGGRVHMTAGAGSGEGRIEKTAHAKKVKRA